MRVFRLGTMGQLGESDSVAKTEAMAGVACGHHRIVLGMKSVCQWSWCQPYGDSSDVGGVRTKRRAHLYRLMQVCRSRG